MIKLNAIISCKISCMGDIKMSGRQRALVRSCCGSPTGFPPFKHKRWMHPLKRVFVLWGAIVAFQWVSLSIWIEKENPWWFSESEFRSLAVMARQSPECKTTPSNVKPALRPLSSFSWLTGCLFNTSQTFVSALNCFTFSLWWGQIQVQQSKSLWGTVRDSARMSRATGILVSPFTKIWR